jgi:hypothetical protein
MLKKAHLLHSPCLPADRLTLRHCGVFQARVTPRDFDCLPIAASAKAGAPPIWAFLSILEK